VAMDPKTGRILALASTPGFDTNSMATHDANAANATSDQLVADPGKPLSNRAIAGDLNPPGPTFKIVVAAAAYASGEWTP
ncbi:penicillin-binding transpeptidase domain-containing protein, partial [Microbacterium sp. GbtcB4]|uniref:penicillin-binding transpeptidase domain-containing protein n=1 Tax=Microbacterium sp. GbtcB4 TaxID=2824749 RepID=UPI0020C70827